MYTWPNPVKPHIPYILHVKRCIINTVDTSLSHKKTRLYDGGNPCVFHGVRIIGNALRRICAYSYEYDTAHSSG